MAICSEGRLWCGGLPTTLSNTALPGWTSVMDQATKEEPQNNLKWLSGKGHLYKQGELLQN